MIGGKGALYSLDSNEPAGNDDQSPAYASPEAVQQRVLRNVFAVIALAVVAAAIFADMRFMLGLVLGGGLALLNYTWLHSSLRGVLAAGSKKAPPGTMIRFVVRWLIVAAVAWAAHKTGYVDAVAILAGLMTPAAAVMIDAGYVVYRMSKTR